MISRTARRRLLILGFWPLFGAFSGLQIQISMLSHRHSWLAVISYQVLVWSLWIPITLAIGALLRRQPFRGVTPQAVVVHAAFALVLAIAHVVAWVAAELIMVPYDFRNPTPAEFWPRFAHVGFYQVPIELVLYGLVVLAFSVDETSARVREHERKAAQLETSLAQARLHALELQTQPHFLFNTLNGIAALVRAGQPREALTMIGGLSDLLRYALDRAGGGTVPLEDEAKTVERYLEIQSLRFPNRLTFEVHVDPGAARAAVPALLLQPLVENAVRHGLSRSEAPGRIDVLAERRGECVAIEIFNTGRLEAARRNGIGITNTVARLSQLHGERASFELAEHDGGVVARVQLPWSEAR